MRRERSGVLDPARACATCGENTVRVSQWRTEVGGGAQRTDWRHLHVEGCDNGCDQVEMLAVR